MPWTKRDYPVSMKNLDPRVRDKAVEIANALLGDGYEEGRAIAIATAKAKAWDDDHPGPADHRSERHNHTASANKDVANLHVVPHDKGWAVKAEGEDRQRFRFETKSEAVERAKSLASDVNKSAIIHRKDGTIETSHNYA